MDENQEKLLMRIKRIEGQVRGIARMIEARQDPRQIVIQISAIAAALDTIKIHIVEEATKKKLLESIETLSELLK